MDIQLFVLRNHTTTIIYNLSILSSASASLIKVPSSLNFNQTCYSVVLNSVTIYKKYWDIYLCGKYDPYGKEVQNLRKVLISLWNTKYPTIYYSCNCLNVDIFPNLVQYSNYSG
jgi:hypothetical protein